VPSPRDTSEFARRGNILAFRQIADRVQPEALEKHRCRHIGRRRTGLGKARADMAMIALTGITVPLRSVTVDERNHISLLGNTQVLFAHLIGIWISLWLLQRIYRAS
jgi:hypothetical protein